MNSIVLHSYSLRTIWIAKDKLTANRTHFEVGKKVRKTIEEIGGTMPENLPGVQSIKLVERKQLKKLPKK